MTPAARHRLRIHAIAWMALALGPVLLSVGVPAAILWRAGELTSAATLASRADAGEPLLVGLAYKGVQATGAAESRKWDVLAIGTSRVLQIRRELFRAGTRSLIRGAPSLEGFQPVLERFSKPPAIIIAGLDPYFFNDDWAERFRAWQTPPVESRNFLREIAANLAVLESNWKSVWTDLWKGKIQWSAIVRDRYGRTGLVGLTARTWLGGARVDGSYRYGRNLAWPEDPELEDYHFHDTFERIEKGRRRFEYGTEVSRESLEQLDRFLTRADELGVEVIGFLPPYANVVWNRMMGLEDKYEYMRRLPAALEAVFERHGMKVYDFSALRYLGATDEEALDGFHAGEKAVARAMAIMARDHSRLREFVDPDALERAIEAAPSPLEVFPLEP